MPHTPGPWEYENVEHRSEQTAYGVVKDANGKILFDTLNSDVAEIHTEHDEGHAYRWDEQGRKNLRLAAASPDLLAACKAARSLIGVQHAGPSLEVSQMLDAAIAKAEAK